MPILLLHSAKFKMICLVNVIFYKFLTLNHKNGIWSQNKLKAENYPKITDNTKITLPVYYNQSFI